MPYERLQTLVQEMFEDIKEVEDKELVLVIGNTGDGKSSLINYLKNSPMQKTIIHETKTLGEGRTRVIDIPVVCVAPGAVEYARIGHQVSSETLHPKAIKADEEDYFYCDCPGFLDNRAQEEQICALLGTQIAIKFAKKVKAILLIVDFRKLVSDDKGNYLRTLVDTLSSLVEKNLGACNNALYFVATKIDSSENESPVERIKDQLYRLSGFIDSQLRNRPDDPDLKRQGAVLTWFIEREITNLLIGNVLDEGASREKISQILRQPSEITKTAFIHSDHNSPDRKIFDEMMREIATQGIKVITDFLETPAKIRSARSENQKIQSSISLQEHRLYHIYNEVCSSQEYNNLIREFYKLISERDSEISSQKRKKQDLEWQKDQYERELQKCKKSGEETQRNYWIDNYDEKETYGIVKQGISNSHYISYIGIPFERVYEDYDIGKGQLNVITNNRFQGIYTAIYYTGLDDHGYCNISIDVKNKSTPEFKSRLKLSESNVQNNSQQLDRIKKNLATLEEQKRSLLRRREESEQRETIRIQRDRDVLDRTLRENLKELERKKSQTLKIIKDLGQLRKNAQQQIAQEATVYVMLMKISAIIDFNSSLLKQFRESYITLCKRLTNLQKVKDSDFDLESLKNSGLFFIRGCFQVENRHYLEAKADFSKAIQLDATNIQYQTALKTVDTEIESFIRQLLCQADCEIKNSNHQKALALYTEALIWNANSKDVYEKRAELYEYLEQFVLAYTDYQQAGLSDSMLSVANKLAAQAKQARLERNFDFAFKNYQQVLAWYPHQIDFQIQYAEFHIDVGQFEKSKQIYLQSGNTDAMSIMADYLLRLADQTQDEQKSLEYFHEALMCCPNRQDVYVKRAKVYENLQEFVLAYTDYQQAQLPEKMFEIANKLLQQAQQARLEKNFELAFKNYKQVLAWYPDQGDFYLQYGEIQIDANQFIEARLSYMRSGNAAAMTIMANHLLHLASQLQDYQIILKYYNEALICCPSRQDIYEQRGGLYEHHGQLILAYVDYQQANLPEKKRGIANILLKQAHQARAEKNFDLALQKYQQVLAWYPQQNKLYIQCGQIQLEMDQFESARQSYQQSGEETAMKQMTDHLVYLAGQTPDYKKSLQHYREALKYFPDRKDIYEKQAELYEHNSQFVLAYINYQQAVLPKKMISSANNVLQQAYQARVNKNFSLALQNYQQILIWYPKRVDLYIHCGEIQLETGQYEEAKRSYQQSCEETAITMMANYCIYLANQTQDYKKSLEYYKEALKYFPDRKDIYEMRGELHEKNNNLSNAYKDYLCAHSHIKKNFVTRKIIESDLPSFISKITAEYAIFEVIYTTWLSIKSHSKHREETLAQLNNLKLSCDKVSKEYYVDDQGKFRTKDTVVIYYKNINTAQNALYTHLCFKSKFRAQGTPALEMLNNKIQLLVTQNDCDNKTWFYRRFPRTSFFKAESTAGELPWLETIRQSVEITFF